MPVRIRDGPEPKGRGGGCRSPRYQIPQQTGAFFGVLPPGMISRGDAEVLPRAGSSQVPPRRAPVAADCGARVGSM